MTTYNSQFGDGFMRKALAIGVVAAPLLLAGVVRSQSFPIAEFDFKAAETQLKDANPVVHHKSLHDAEREPDGTKGFGLPQPEVYRVALPNPPPPPFHTKLEWETYDQYCGWNASAIVRATHIDSTPVLTSEKTLIYTISHFAVVDTIKSDVPFTPGEMLVAYRVGGEVEDGGEKLRIDTPDSAAFEPKKDYILILRRDKNASVQQYFIPLGQTIAVTNDKVYPISGRFSWLSGMDAFPSGSAYSAIRGSFAEVHRRKPCGNTL
jgi:hypothetical protein